MLIQKHLNQTMVEWLYNQNVSNADLKSQGLWKQEAKALLNNFVIKTPLSKIPLLNVLF